MFEKIEITGRLVYGTRLVVMGNRGVFLYHTML